MQLLLCNFYVQFPISEYRALEPSGRLWKEALGREKTPPLRFFIDGGEGQEFSSGKASSRATIGGVGSGEGVIGHEKILFPDFPLGRKISQDDRRPL